MSPGDRQPAHSGRDLLDRPHRLALARSTRAHGKWNTVWRRFARWRDAEIYEAVLEALVASGAGDLTIQMIDSTVIRAHQHSAGARKGGFI
jgi:transposase